MPLPLRTTLWFWCFFLCQSWYHKPNVLVKIQSVLGQEREFNVSSVKHSHGKLNMSFYFLFYSFFFQPQNNSRRMRTKISGWYWKEKKVGEEEPWWKCHEMSSKHSCGFLQRIASELSASPRLQQIFTKASAKQQIIKIWNFLLFEL